MSDGYLSKFDLVLSISERAMNHQLEHLYNQEVKGPLQPPPPAPQIPKQYLINHTLEIKLGSTTLSAKIAAPTVSWTRLSNTANRDRTVKMTFKFLSGSKFTTYGVELKGGKPSITTTDLDIPGYSMSFEASLGRADIQQIEEKALHPNVAQAVKGYVASEDFLVSSLFCLFESTQIANTFNVYDDSGVSLSSHSEDTLGSWMLLITNHFTQMKEPGSKNGNPYILGYAVQQHPQRHVGAAQFAPRSFQFSTTSEGTPTLNFLMLTGDHQVNIETDPAAGRFPQSFFTTINASPAASNGILAVSRNMIAQKFISENIVPAFWCPAPRIPNHSVHTDSAGTTSQGENTTRTLDWSTGWRGWDNTFLNYRDAWNGKHTLKIDYTSDSQINRAGVGPEDAQRRFLIDIAGRLRIDYVRESVTKGLDNYSEAYKAWFDLPYQTRLVVKPTADGAWNIEKDPDMTHFPAVDNDNKIVFTRHSNYDIQGKGFFAILDFFNFCSDITNDISNQMQSVASKEWSDVVTEMEQDLKGLSTKIIMPAGDVFEFAGLNTDEAGNVYSGINYSTLTNGTIVKAQAELKSATKMHSARENAKAVEAAVAKMIDVNKTFMQTLKLNGAHNPTLVNLHKALLASQTAAMMQTTQLRAVAA